MASFPDKHSRAVSRLLEDLYQVGAVYQHGQNLIISLTPIYNSRASLKILKDRLRLAGYKFQLEDKQDQLLLTLDPEASYRIPKLNLILFIITLGSVYFVPVFLRELSPAILFVAEKLTGGAAQAAGEFDLTMQALPIAFDRTIAALRSGAGVEFTLAMISILLVHEMGHFVASRRRDIITSWPYFIPAPNIIGTFGAVIRSRSPFWNRRDLLEVGAAGPIAGWIVAFGWLLYGLTQSGYYPESAIGLGEMAFSLEGESLLMKFLAPAIIGAPPAGHFYLLTEAAFAGWVGLLVTAINMLPIGQLDGGHILYGLARRSQHYFGIVAMAALLLLGLQSPIWWLFAALGMVFGIKHPPTLDDDKKPSRISVVMGIAALIILVLSFTPVPFR